MPTRNILAIFAAIALCAIASAPLPAAQRLNVLLITSEDNGPEVACYGDPYVRTPNLDRMAAEGTLFEKAYVTNPVCSPSRGTIFTGLYPHQNGQIGLATHKYAMFKKWPNVVSLLKKAGYRTGIIGKIHVNPESAFPTDFRAFPGSNFNNRPVKAFAEKAGEFINAGDEPFFLMMNYPDAHFPLLRQQHGIPANPLTANDVKTLPFVGADSPRLRKFTADYYNCMERLDVGIGMLMTTLKQSGKAGNTLVIYLGDHGTQFSRGKTTLYEAGTRVPFIIWWPGHAKAGIRRSEMISTIDILPTILDATGLQAPKNLPGHSLLGLCRGEEVNWRQHIFTEMEGSAPFWTHPRRAVTDGRYKLIVNLRQDKPNPSYGAYLNQMNAHFAAGTNAAEIAAARKHVHAAYAVWLDAPPIELYDLDNDPCEWKNLADDARHQATKQRLLTSLKQWQVRTRDPLADPKKLQMLIDEMDGVVANKINYRKDKNFRWKYLEYLKPE